MFRIARDERNFILQEWSTRLSTKPSKSRGGHWRNDGYFGTLEDLAKHLLNRQIVIPAGTLEAQIPALLAEVKAAEARIVEGLKSEVYA